MKINHRRKHPKHKAYFSWIGGCFFRKLRMKQERANERMWVKKGDWDTYIKPSNVLTVKEHEMYY